MGIRITQVLGDFPSNEEYQIVDVTQIFIKDGEKVLSVKFQNLCTEEIISKSISIAYARLIVIGSIWRNNCKVRFPSFINQFQVFNFDFSQNAISNKQFEFDDFDSYLFNTKLKSITSKTNNLSRDTNYNLITYDVNLCLVKNEGEVTKLFKPRSDWKNHGVISFISFFPHEVFRYFFTSYEISDLNDHLYSYNNSKGNWSVNNGVFSTIESINNENEFYVCLKNQKYLKDTNLIGDCIYLPAFKGNIFAIQNFLNTKGFAYLSRIGKFPIDTCRQLKFLGKSVIRRSDGANGLHVFLIEDCVGFRPRDYTAIIPDHNEQMNTTGNSIPRFTVAGNGANEVPTIQNSSSSSSRKYTIEETGLEFLLEYKPTHKVKKVVRNIDKSSKLLLTDEVNILSSPSAFGDSFGRTTKLNDYFPQTIYFEDYHLILEGIINEIRNRGLSIKVSHYLDTKEWGDELTSVNRILFSENISSAEFREEKLYITQMVIGDFNSITRYYYLIEANNGTRTLLYSSVDFQMIFHDEISNCLKYFPKAKNSSDSLKGAVVHYFNHRQRMKDNIKRDAQGKIIDYNLIQVTTEEAINNHIRRITKILLSSSVNVPY